MGRGSAEDKRRRGLRLAVAALVREVVAGDEQAVFPSVRRETAQAVGEKQIGRQPDWLIVPPGALVLGGQWAGQRVAPLGPVELAGERAPIAHDDDACGGLEQDLFVLLHDGGFEHEHAAGLVDPVGSAIGTDHTQQLLASSSS